MGGKTARFSFLGLYFDWPVIISTIAAMAILFITLVWMSNKLSIKPNRKQNVLESIIEFTNGIVEKQLPGDKGKNLKLYAFSLFTFIFVANQLGLGLIVSLNKVVYLRSVTTNPIVTMTLALISLGIAHFLGVQELGFKRYFKSLYLRPYPVLLPLNIIEQLTSFLTLGLRLFGNIFAGEVVLTLLWQLAISHGIFTMVPSFILTMIWQAFSLFIGSIQAYVFTTLTMVYISQTTIEE